MTFANWFFMTTFFRNHFSFSLSIISWLLSELNICSCICFRSRSCCANRRTSTASCPARSPTARNPPRKRSRCDLMDRLLQASSSRSFPEVGAGDDNMDGWGTSRSLIEVQVIRVLISPLLRWITSCEMSKPCKMCCQRHPFEMM
jgi:hypothetical protein